MHNSKTDFIFAQKITNMQYILALIITLVFTACQGGESTDHKQNNTKEINKQDTSHKQVQHNKLQPQKESIQLDHPCWLYEYESKSTGKIYLFFTPQKEQYQLDMFIYDKKGTQSLFARLGFKGNFPSDSSIFKLPADDIFFSNIKTSDGVDMPFPVEQSPNISIDLNSKALVLPNRFLYPATSIRMTQRDSLIALQEKWKGKNVVFK